MLINIGSAASLEMSELKTKIMQLGYPAFLLDENTKILLKNREAEKKFSKMRRGSLFANCLSKGYGAYISEMTAGESLSATLLSSENETVTLFRCADCFLAIFFPILDEIQKSISEKYSMLSGYDVPSVPIELNGEGKRFAEFARVALKLLDKAGRNHALPVFNAATTIETLVSELETLGYGGDIIDLKIASNNLLSRGSELDFIMISAFIVSVCFKLSGSGIGILLDTRGDETVLNVFANGSCDKSEDFVGLADIKSNRPPENEASFWLYMLKLVADANLWELLCKSRSDGGIEFSLFMPYVHSGGEMLVFESRRDIVSAVVSALLCK